MRNPPKNVPPKGIPQQTPEQETEEASVNQVISSVENLIQNENTGNDTITTLFAENSHAQKNVLLQTSQAFVSSVNSTSKGQRRVLFDNCSRKSFVTNDVKEQLKLLVIKSENISIKVFGSTKTNLEKFDVVQLKIQSCSSSNFRIIEAIVVPTICSPLSGQFTELAKNQYTHLNNIQLSDCKVNNSDSQIDVLTDADHYWDVMTGEVKRGSKGPVVVKTVLGWVLNGTFQLQSSSQTSVNLCDSHVLKMSTIEQKSICNNKFTSFGKSKTVTKRKTLVCRHLFKK